MRPFLTLAIFGFCCSLSAQETINYPYNPDEDGNGQIAIGDLQGVLAAYGNAFAPSEILINGETLTTVMTELQSSIDSLSQEVQALANDVSAQNNNSGNGGFVSGSNCDRIGTTAYHLDYSQFVVCSPYVGPTTGFIDAEQPLSCADKIGDTASNLTFWMSFEVNDTVVVRGIDFDPQKKVSNLCGDVSGYNLDVYAIDAPSFSSESIGPEINFLHKALLPGFVYTIRIDNLGLSNGNCFSCGYGAAMTSVGVIQERLSEDHFSNVHFFRSDGDGALQEETQSWLLSLGVLFDVSPIQELRWDTVGSGSINWN